MSSNGRNGSALSEWDIALIGEDNKQLSRLIRLQAPVVVYKKFKELFTTSCHMISTRPHEMIRKLEKVSPDAKEELEESIRTRLRQKMPYFFEFRRNLGWPIQELNIEHLRTRRRESCLTLVWELGSR